MERSALRTQARVALRACANSLSSGEFNPSCFQRDSVNCGNRSPRAWRSRGRVMPNLWQSGGGRRSLVESASQAGSDDDRVATRGNAWGRYVCWISLAETRYVGQRYLRCRQPPGATFTATRSGFDYVTGLRDRLSFTAGVGALPATGRIHLALRRRKRLSHGSRPDGR
jgi:hypothetical protein